MKHNRNKIMNGALFGGIALFILGATLYSNLNIINFIIGGLLVLVGGSFLLGFWAQTMHEEVYFKKFNWLIFTIIIPFVSLIFYFKNYDR